MRVDDVSSKVTDDSVVTEEEIRQFLAKGPMKTKDLVHTFRAKLKKDSSNLHRIKEIIRKIGVVKSSTEVGEGEKIVYLKEWKNLSKIILYKDKLSLNKSTDFYRPLDPVSIFQSLSVETSRIITLQP